MKLLTLAIASYNMEAFLDQCLESVTNFDIPDSLEVLVVNDGSNDKTSNIAHVYQQLRPDIIKVIDKKNGHYGSCINKALSVATGKYFRPLDADDWVNTDSLLQLLNKLATCTADLVITEICVYKKDGKDNLTIPKNIEIDRLYDAKSFDVEKNKCTSLFAMHGMTYRTQLLKDLGLHLHTGIHYTDTEYILLPLDHINKLIFYKLNLYQYNTTREGQSIQKSIQHQALDSFYILSYDLIKHYKDRNPYNNTIVRSNQRCILRRVFFYFYVSALIFADFSIPRLQEEMKNIEELIDDNVEIKHDAYNFSYKGIPFVKIWYKYHIRIFDYLPFLK